MSRRIITSVVLLILFVIPAAAQQSASTFPSQEHGHHEHGHQAQEEEPPPDHSEMDHSQPEHPAHDSEMDHSDMDHSQMDHSQMGHGEHSGTAGEARIPRTPSTAPVEPYFHSPEMDRARAQARREMGGGRLLALQADRLEWRSGEGEPVALFEGQGWYGGDRHRLWVKADAELLLDAPAGDEEFDGAELQALYSRPISPYFDLQVGLRRDFEPSPSRTFAVVGVQGLAPQWFEVDLALFLSEDGDLSSRLEAEYDMLFTQKLMLQLWAEVELEGSDVPELGLGSGLSAGEVGVRLSYGRVVAPYVGLEWERVFGGTADFARVAGEETSDLSAVVGLKMWY